MLIYIHRACIVFKFVSTNKNEKYVTCMYITNRNNRNDYSWMHNLEREEQPTSRRRVFMKVIVGARRPKTILVYINTKQYCELVHHSLRRTTNETRHALRTDKVAMQKPRRALQNKYSNEFPNALQFRFALIVCAVVQFTASRSSNVNEDGGRGWASGSSARRFRKSTLVAFATTAGECLN